MFKRSINDGRESENVNLGFQGKLNSLKLPHESTKYEFEITFQEARLDFIPTQNWYAMKIKKDNLIDFQSLNHISNCKVRLFYNEFC